MELKIQVLVCSLHSSIEYGSKKGADEVIRWIERVSSKYIDDRALLYSVQIVHRSWKSNGFAYF